MKSRDRVVKNSFGQAVVVAWEVRLMAEAGGERGEEGSSCVEVICGSLTAG